MYLVDTNVISESAPSRTRAHASVAAWMDEHASLLHLSTITVTEIEAGIAKARRQGAIARARELGHWLDRVLHYYGERVLPFDVEIARLAGALSDAVRSSGRFPGFEDIALAATAKSRSFIVLTRNLRHFAPLDVVAIDPYDTLPP